MKKLFYYIKKHIKEKLEKQIAWHKFYLVCRT